MLKNITADIVKTANMLPLIFLKRDVVIEIAQFLNIFQTEDLDIFYYSRSRFLAELLENILNIYAMEIDLITKKYQNWLCIKAPQLGFILLQKVVTYRKEVDLMYPLESTINLALRHSSIYGLSKELSNWIKALDTIGQKIATDLKLPSLINTSKEVKTFLDYMVDKKLRSNKKVLIPSEMSLRNIFKRSHDVDIGSLVLIGDKTFTRENIEFAYLFIKMATGEFQESNILWDKIAEFHQKDELNNTSIVSNISFHSEIGNFFEQYDYTDRSDFDNKLKNQESLVEWILYASRGYVLAAGLVNTGTLPTFSKNRILKNNSRRSSLLQRVNMTIINLKQTFNDEPKTEPYKTNDKDDKDTPSPSSTPLYSF